MTDREDRDVDDLFGDLDEFFAPIKDVDWPEGEEPEGEQAAEAAPARDEPEAAPDDRGGEGPADQELVGPAARAPEDEGEEPGVVAGEPPVDEASFAEAPPGGEPEEPLGPPVEPESRVDEATAEMTGEEWDRLRSALGEEPPGGGDAPAVPEEEPDPDLTVDDLVELPSEEPHVPPIEPDEEPFVESVLAEEALFQAEEPPPPVVREGPEEPVEATSEDVEAAARHFAGGIEPEEVERELLSDLEADEAPPLATEPEEEPLAGPASPAWREPAAYEIEDEAADAAAAEAAGPPPPTEGRSVPAAVASGAILAAAAIALLAIGRGPFVVLAIALVTLGQGELYAAFKARGFQPATAIGLVAGILTMAGAYVHGAVPGQGESAMLFGLALGAVLAVPWYMAASPGARQGLVANVGVTVLGIVYGPVLVSFALILLAAPDVGINIFLTVIGLTVLYDICAYAIGTLWGDRPLAPTISPRKSWEGAFGATFVLLLVGVAIVPMIDPFTAAQAVGLSLVIALAAPLGDLVESAIKRDLGVKDMGTLLPGHGGVLDRIDAILFTAPAAYYFLRLVA